MSNIRSPRSACATLVVDPTIVFGYVMHVHESHIKTRRESAIN